jgi:flagellar hook-basal body complex protein FliE
MTNTILTGLPGLSTSLPTSPTPATGVDAGENGGFGATLKNAINKVDQLQQNSDASTTQLVQGDRQDIHNVMIAVEKADIAFQLMMQVRNKIVNAYQDVSKLQF